ncbi:hypothetical protein ACT17S_10185 [Glutamicibacter mysorens]|uniref:hypothetical protein n=1 Tax=Glutamicibacter sp. 0426 TaxID=1913445 RepID=UPI00093D47B6|nr:hypothetical protein [Glutamicibacter sp. 0426]
MDLHQKVFPLKALSPDGDGSFNVGTGFLISVDNQVYLVTVAHLATGKVSQTDDWTLWADQIQYAPTGTSETVMSLFDVGTFGNRRPRFKFLRAHDIPSVLVDMILLPLDPDDLILNASEIFHLPVDLVNDLIPGQTLYMVGCAPWPEKKVQLHSLVMPDVVHLVEPPQTDGFSGCPVVDGEGLLVGMAYGTVDSETVNHGQVLAAQLFERAVRYLDNVG